MMSSGKVLKNWRIRKMAKTERKNGIISAK